MSQLQFKQWFFEAEEKQIKYGGWISDGRVMVYIGDRLYTYTIDAKDHTRLKNYSKKAPWRALNIIKKMDSNPKVQGIRRS
jgi:hypothetical protein